jgi:hypothetical protein
VIQSKSTSCLVQNFWMESPFIFNLSVLHVWFKTWMESPCMFNLSGSKLSDGIFLYDVLNQTSTDKLNKQEDSIQKFGIGQEEQTSWTYRVISSKSFVPDIKHWQVCQYFMSGSKLGLNHPVCSICQYFISGSKLLDGITLYVQLVCSSCLVQNLYWQIEHTGWFNPSFEPDIKYWQIEHTGRFNPKVWNRTRRTNKLNSSKLGWNHPVCLICQYFMSGLKLLDGITLYVQFVSTSYLVQKF